MTDQSKKAYREWRIEVADDDFDSSIIGPHTYGKEVHVIDIQALKDVDEKIKELEAEIERMGKAHIEFGKMMFKDIHDAEDKIQPLETKNQILIKALNRIAMLGSGSKAYTKDFTNEVNDIARVVLLETEDKI